ncbi:hypothetical protein BDV09DRAFT_131110 [Aspergillus tetrazonus]
MSPLNLRQPSSQGLGKGHFADLSRCCWCMLMCIFSVLQPKQVRETKRGCLHVVTEVVNSSNQLLGQSYGMVDCATATRRTGAPRPRYVECKTWKLGQGILTLEYAALRSLDWLTTRKRQQASEVHTRGKTFVCCL